MADVIVKPPAQIPVTAHFSKTRQRHRVIEKAVAEILDMSWLHKRNRFFHFSGHTPGTLLFTKQNKPSATAVASEINAPPSTGHGRYTNKISCSPAGTTTP